MIQSITLSKAVAGSRVSFGVEVRPVSQRLYIFLEALLQLVLQEPGDLGDGDLEARPPQGFFRLRVHVAGADLDQRIVGTPAELKDKLEW